MLIFANVNLFCCKMLTKRDQKWKSQSKNLKEIPLPWNFDPKKFCHISSRISFTVFSLSWFWILLRNVCWTQFVSKYVRSRGTSILGEVRNRVAEWLGRPRLKKPADEGAKSRWGQPGSSFCSAQCSSSLKSELRKLVRSKRVRTHILRHLFETKKDENILRMLETFEVLGSKERVINIDDVAERWAFKDKGNMMPHHQIAPFFVKS